MENYIFLSFFLFFEFVRRKRILQRDLHMLEEEGAVV